jgi:hypothetical protein
MLLKPLSQNVFFAALVVTTIVFVSFALAEPMFGPLFAREGMQDWLRQVIVPMFQA